MRQQGEKNTPWWGGGKTERYHTTQSVCGGGGCTMKEAANRN